MCEWEGNKRVQASRYLSAAKKRSKQLKKLKSVSRAYRKAEVRGMKAEAFRLQQEAEIEDRTREQNRRQYEMLRNAPSLGSQYSGMNAIGNGILSKIFR